MKTRVLERGYCDITQIYSDSHQAIDMVGETRTLDYVVAHSDGRVIFYQDGYGNMKGSIGNKSYSNFIKLEHQNGYYTLYAHMKNDLPIKNNQYVKKGQVIGYISDSGNAYGKHLHFEVWKGNARINPTKYLNEDLIISTPSVDIKYKVGDIVEINGVYISSTSKEKLRPIITIGKITSIIENVNNPYLLEEGRIGWINDDNIIRKLNNQYLSNKNYQGTSIVDALKQINIDSSYSNRTNLAKINNIDNYQGTSSQNTKMLDLLKQGLLKY